MLRLGTFVLYLRLRIVWGGLFARFLGYFLLKIVWGGLFAGFFGYFLLRIVFLSGYCSVYVLEKFFTFRKRCILVVFCLFIPV